MARSWRPVWVGTASQENLVVEINKKFRAPRENLCPEIAALKLIYMKEFRN
jgi:hypothetical protein